MSDNTMVKQFPSGKEIMLYGQHDYVVRVRTYLERLRPDLRLVTVEMTPVAEEIDASELDTNALDKQLNGCDCAEIIIICLPAKWQSIAQSHRQSMGFEHLYFYDAVMDNRLKAEYFRNVYAEQGKPFVLLNDMSNEHAKHPCTLTVYMAKCVVDKSLSKEPELPACVVPIQVGAALTDKRIAELTDDTGDNISERNRRYSETTALYWMWKNAKSDWLGLCHYRRLFVDIEEIADKLQQVDIDALLPLPTLCEHSVFEDYLLKHIPTVWRPMMDVLRELSPEYYEVAEQIFKGLVFYASNMFILRREVLDDLCQWMFPVVMEVERRVGELRDTYYNRYAGFVTERLITLYFIHNKRGWRIAHVEKVFIG